MITINNKILKLNVALCAMNDTWSCTSEAYKIRSLSCYLDYAKRFKSKRRCQAPSYV